MIYNRGQREDFDSWAQRGNRGWGYVDMLPYFKRMERRIGEGDETYRGRDGNLPVTDHGLASIRSARPSWTAPSSLGIPRNPDYNGAIAGGRRPTSSAPSRTACGISAATAFLHPARKRRQCRRAHACACHQRHLRGQARGRRALSQRRRGRHAGRGARQQGSHSFRRHLQLAAGAAIVRRRLAGIVAIARHRGASRAAWRRRGPAGSLRAALGRARQEHPDHQRNARAA